MKRATLAVLALAATAPLLVSASAPSSFALEEPAPDLSTRRDGSDWERFLGPAGNNRSTETGVSTAWPEAGPRLVWGLVVGEGYSGPTVSRGRLFHFDRYGDDARLSCRRSETGELLWQRSYPMEYEDYYDYSNGPRASPLVDGDRVYTFGVEGRLRCHRVVDGELWWDVDTTAAFGVVQNFFGVGSTPAVEGDLLIVPVGGSPPGTPRIHSGKVVGNGSGIVAFDKLTGEVRYRISDELASYASPVLATIGGRRWAFAFQRGGLLAFEPASGEIDFHYPWKSQTLESVNASSPVVVDDTVLISETYGPGSSLLRVAPGRYEVIWKDPPRRGQSLSTHWNTPIHHDGYLYASSGRNTGDAALRCVEHATGKVRWSESGLTRSTLLYADGHLMVLGEYGTLRLVRATPASYQLVAEADLHAVRSKLPAADGPPREVPLLSYPAWNAPVLSHGLLYLRGKDTLIALELIPQPVG
jgi:outer membrane protein assembly factor BamB